MEMMINQWKRLWINNLFGVFVDGYGVKLMGYFYGLLMCGVGVVMGLVDVDVDVGLDVNVL